MTKLVRLLILMSMLVLLFALNVGVAFADHGGGTEWTCDKPQNGGGCAPGDRNLIGPAAQNAFAPVGSSPANPNTDGLTKGNGNALNAIANNPLCPLHPVEVTP